MEFLIATAALTFREEGARFVSLSGAPLAWLDRGEQSRALQRLLDMIANTMEPVYGFQSLLHLKAKFQPLYQTYPDPAELGSIATAIGRAYYPTSRRGRPCACSPSSAGRTPTTARCSSAKGDAPDTRRYGGHRPSDPPQKRRVAGNAA